MQHGWVRWATLTLTVHSTNSAHTVSREATHKFFAEESDWGFTSFAPLQRILDPAHGFLVRVACPPARHKPSTPCCDSVCMDQVGDTLTGQKLDFILKGIGILCFRLLFCFVLVRCNLGATPMNDMQSSRIEHHKPPPPPAQKKIPISGFQCKSAPILDYVCM